MDWKILHLIKDRNINIIYHCGNMKLTVVNDNTYNVVKFLQEGLSIQEIACKSGLSANSIVSFIQSIETSLSQESSSSEQTENSIRKVGRITLHVANDCNLRCRYCYAEGGNYHQERSLMNRSTAEAFVNFCVQNFDQIDSIVYFGGEPVLNLEIMQYICDLFKKYYAENKSSFMPKFAIITNGTLLTPDVLQFMKENIYRITVSIDGPEEINDMNRIYKNGTGSYKRIHHFIHTILQETDISVGYEATFTQSHLDAGYKHEDIEKFMSEEFGITGTIVTENSIDHKDWHILSLDELEQNDFTDTPESFWNILFSIVYGQEMEICPIMNDIFAVNVNGMIYPCHMLNGEMRNLGNIRDRHIFNSPALYKSDDYLFHLKQNNKCAACWGKKLCGGCAVKNFYDEETHQFLVTPKEHLCELKLSYLEQILVLIATIRQRKDVWSRLLEKVKEKHF